MFYEPTKPMRVSDADMLIIRCLYPIDALADQNMSVVVRRFLRKWLTSGFRPVSGELIARSRLIKHGRAQGVILAMDATSRWHVVAQQGHLCGTIARQVGWETWWLTRLLLLRVCWPLTQAWRRVLSRTTARRYPSTCS